MACFGKGVAVEVNGLKHAKTTSTVLWAPQWASLLKEEAAGVTANVYVQGKV